MKQIIAVSIAALVAAGAMTGAAHAADIGGSKDAVSPFALPESSSGVTNWTGFYVGGALGYSNTNHDLSVQEYFKDFCYDADDVAAEGFDPWQAWEWDGDHTVANHNKNHYGPTYTPINNNAEHPYFRTSCETRTGAAAGTGEIPTPAIPTATGDATVGGQSREVLGIDGLNSSGLSSDLRIGYDHAVGRWIGGVFATYGFGGQETSLRAATLDIDAIEQGDSWSAGARIGYIVAPRTMVYALAAYRETEYSFSGVKMLDTPSPVGGARDVTFSGVEVGGGIEFALAQNIFFGLEGTHTFYGKETIADRYDAGDNEGVRVTDKPGETKVMGTLKIKLNGLSN